MMKIFLILNRLLRNEKKISVRSLIQNRRRLKVRAVKKQKKNQNIKLASQVKLQVSKFKRFKSNLK